VARDSRLVRLARFLMSLHARRQALPPGSRERAVMELVEAEAETELRQEADRLDVATAEPWKPAHAPVSERPTDAMN
jgi:hypothetical protein